MQSFWDQRYATETYVYGTNPNTFFKQYIDANAPGTLLLPAEGEGRNAVYAALKGWEVTAFDTSPVAREKALKLARENQVDLHYLQEDVNAFTTREKYDCIALIYAHFHSQVRNILHRKLSGFLKQNGDIILEAFSKEQLHMHTGGPKNIDMLYAPSELEKDFSHMEIISLEKHQMELNEGPFHQGEASVIRCIARNKA